MYLDCVELQKWFMRGHHLNLIPLKPKPALYMLRKLAATKDGPKTNEFAGEYDIKHEW